MKKVEIQKRRIAIGIIFILSFFIILYLGGVVYFRNHFTFGTEINGMNVSGKTVEEVEKMIDDEISNYYLILEERDGIKEEIKGTDMGLKYEGSNALQEIKDNQNSFTWILSIFKSASDNICKAVTICDDLVEKSIDNLDAISGNEIVEAKDATLEYINGSFEIIEEVYGNKLNKDILINKVKSAVLQLEDTLNLDEAGCYVQPKFISTSDEVISAKENINKYLESKIIYELGGSNEYLDGSVFKDWLSVDENMDVIINESKVKKYISKIAYKYNTVDKSREFLTSRGKIVRVPKGNYGWKIDVSGEVEKLISNIKEGREIIREPKYRQRAAVIGRNDYGNTYVEIDLTAQHVWFYKNGALLTEGDIVTGSVANKWETPAGIYSLNYKERNATLRGENYQTPVNYWMPFNGGIGIHDALWRSEFGKDIYIQGGSHGCVNAPYEVAKVIFDNIKPGDPVILYTQ